MAWRFRRSIRLLPGVTINLSNKGISTTLGSSPLSVNIGRRGVSRTLSIPGTGLSNHQMLSGSPAMDRPSNGGSSGCATLVLLAAVSLLVVTCNNSRTEKPSAPIEPAVAAASINQPMYAKTTANCRSEASTSSPVAGKLFHGRSAMAIEQVGMFHKVQLQDGTTCHIASRLLSETPPPMRQSRMRTAQAVPTPRYSNDDGCPCSGYRNCTGPRGGSFCYTSGGRKRYR